MEYSFIENQWGEQYIEEINRHDFTSMPSADFFDRIISCNFDVENTCFIVCGSDSGLLLRWISKQKLGRGSHVAVVEDDAVYSIVAPQYRGLLETEATKNKTQDPFSKKLSFHKFSQWQKEILENPQNNWLSGGSFTILESHASSTDYARLYMPMHRSLQRAIEERIVKVSSYLNNAIFTEMQFRNSTDNAQQLKTSNTFGEHKTAVVIGGGPSIDLHIPWIEENRDKFFVIAVSRVAGKLIKRNFAPDLLVSVDPYDFSYEICKPGLIWTDVPLAHNYHVSSKLLQQWQAATFCLGNRLPWQAPDLHNEHIPASGPTVGHTAAIIAAQLGFSQILLTGIDLCFSTSASTHASDSPEEMIQSMPSLCDAQVQTYTGRMAGTSVKLKNYAIDLQNIGISINKDGHRLFNLSEDAARCESIPFIDYKKVVLPDEKPKFIDYVETLKPFASLEDLQWLEKEFKRATLTFEKLIKHCKEAKGFVSKIHTTAGHNSTTNYANKLSKLRKKLDLDYADHLQAILFYKKRELTRTDTPTDFDEMKPDELIEWGQRYYKIIESGAKDMLNYIKEHESRVQLRMQEHETEVDIRSLMKQWRDDDTPARLLRWKQHYWNTVKPVDRAWVQRTVGKLRSTFNTTAESVSDKLLSSHHDIFKTVKSLVFLSENEKLEELESIEIRLDDTLWPYSALKPFTAGLIDQIRGNPTDAISYFQTTVDDCSKHLEDESVSSESMLRLLEECLVRMTQCFLKTKNHKSALETLGMLCEILPTYVVSYAKMLNLHGQPEFAVELLQSYVELYPSNKKAQFILEEISQKQNLQNVEQNPIYEKKIAGAVQAIMGS